MVTNQLLSPFISINKMHQKLGIVFGCSISEASRLRIKVENKEMKDLLNTSFDKLLAMFLFGLSLVLIIISMLM